jgi:hypothetical protein
VSDRAEPDPADEYPPEGIEEPEAEAAVEDAAWAALVALLGAAAAAVIVEGLVNLDLWPIGAWDPSDILARAGEVYADQFYALWPDADGEAPEVPTPSADDSGRRARQWIARRENLLTRVGDEVFVQVQSLVLTALRTGMSERALAGYVADILNPDTTVVDWQARAQRIARTEVHTAEQAGQAALIDQLVTSGAIDPPRFAWVNAGDNRVRPRPALVGPFDHHGIEPVTWPNAFNVSGEALLFPGDPNGSPGNVINCRCARIRIG